jgi:hypothetical protein
MSSDDKEFLKEFSRGVAFCIAVVGGVIMFVAIFGTVDKGPVEKYKVVDHYGTCAVVRYTDDSQRWHYFLDCREVR